MKSINFAFLLSALLVSNLLAGEPSFVETQIKKLKSAKSKSELIKPLMDLGLSAQYLDSLLGPKSEEDLLLPKFLKRAESFKINLDSNSTPEVLSQLQFEGAKSQDPDQRKVYLILVHHEEASSSKLILCHPFDLIYCSKNNKGKMVFSFKNANGKPWKRVFFKVSESESCGLEVSGYKRTDTLELKNGEVKFTEGEHANESEFDRAHPPE